MEVRYLRSKCVLALGFSTAKKSTVPRVYNKIKGKTINQRLGFDIWRRHFILLLCITVLLAAGIYVRQPWYARSYRRQKDSHETYVPWESELVAGEGLEPTTSGL